MMAALFFPSCHGPQPREFTERIEYEYFVEGGPHFRVTFFHNSSKFGYGWYEGLEGCGVPGVQPLSLTEGAVRDLIRTFHDIDFFSMPRVPRPSSGPWGITLTYRDDLRVHEVVDYYGDNPKLKRLQEQMRKAVDIEKYLEPTMEVYRNLVAAGWEVNTADTRGQTALAHASRKQDLASVRFLLQNGAAVNIGALENAAAGKNPEIFFSLLAEYNSPPKAPDRFRLLIAAAQGNMEVSRRLIKEGIDLNAHDREGWTPLSAAVRYGNADLAQLLLASGAEANLREPVGERRTPLMMAVESGSLPCTRVLLEKGADPGLRDNSGRTALAYAAWKDNTSYITQLAGRKADVNARDKWGRTPLMQAAAICKEWNVGALLAVGADPTIADNDGKTALQAISIKDTDPKCARCRALLDEALRNATGKASKKPPL